VRIPIWTTCLLLAGIFLWGCGYRFTGGGALPAGLKTVFIQVLENRTSETGVENTFTADLRYEFIRNNKIAEQETADSVLSGVIESMSVETVSRRGTQTSLERRASFTVALKLKNRDGKAIWARNISADETYTVSSDKLTTEGNRRKAIVELSKHLAEGVYNSLTGDF
jgi:outer membrane lipopolysaccharide assembly protein LptE/RlpB